MTASAGISQTAPAADTNSTIAISLTDQWEKPAVLQAPLDRVTLLTVADRAGAEQINAWLAPLKAEFGTNLQFFAVADVSAVPGPLRGLVRRRFAKEYNYAIGLDWKGTVTDQLPVTPKLANLFVLDDAARIVHTVRGEVAVEPLRELLAVIRRLQSQAADDDAGTRHAARPPSP